MVDASGFEGRAERSSEPRDEAEAVAVLREASAARTPVTVAGAWTGLTGGAVPQSGWVLSLLKLNSVVVHPGYAICGPGLLLRELQRAAAATGQLYPPDPTENSASLGGTIATNASGSRSFLYGPTRGFVRSLRVVLMNGDVLQLRRTRPPLRSPVKNTAGYLMWPGMEDIDLFIGSEGTLGVVVEAEVGLLPLPQSLFSGVVFFGSDEEALDAVDAWRCVPGLRMLEYMDAASLALSPDVPDQARAALLVERDGDDWFPDGGLDASWFAAGAADRERFRRFRHALPEKINHLMRGRRLTKLGSDFAVPVARNREMLSFYREALDREFPGQYVIFGHMGDAHLHVNILPSSEAEHVRAKDLMTDFARHAVALGGTVSAEHGLGKSKKHYLPLQYGEAESEAMKAVKQRFDPDWLLGQGTLF